MREINGSRKQLKTENEAGKMVFVSYRTNPEVFM